MKLQITQINAVLISINQLIRGVCIYFGTIITAIVATATTIIKIVVNEKYCAGRTFLLEYAYAGQSPVVKPQIVDMAMNASGIRDTARVLHISPNTVLAELKKGTCARASEPRGVA